MSKRSSQSGGGRTGPRRVALLVDRDSNPFEMSCAIEVFGLQRPELDADLYEVVLCAEKPTTRMRDGFFVLSGVADLAIMDSAETIIVPNRPDITTPHSTRILDALRRAHARGARLVGLCSGAFTLAEAGLLDGRRATCHWMWADAFEARFPGVQLERDVLGVDDGDILTAAGSASALDLGLHIVRSDYGADIANAVSRRLVFATRNGGQRQFIEQPVPSTQDDWLSPTLDWARAHLAERLTVAQLAARAAVSQATLHRRFLAQLGTTPLAWITASRVALACRYLERGDTSLDAVAARVGLGTAANLRLKMRAGTGLSPSEYRRRFGPATQSALA